MTSKEEGVFGFCDETIPVVRWKTGEEVMSVPWYGHHDFMGQFRETCDENTVDRAVQAAKVGSIFVEGSKLHELHIFVEAMVSMFRQGVAYGRRRT